MRSGIFGIIAVAFLALEMLGVVLVGREIGALATLFWLLADVIAGAWVIRHAGAGFPARLAQALHQQQAPLGLIWATGRRFVAGALLILPGPISDFMALVLLLWPAPRSPVRPGARPGDAGGDGIIEGEFRREQD
jgi:UPF0716 protein FxsA